jgi:hypothetical protein
MIVHFVYAAHEYSYLHYRIDGNVGFVLAQALFIQMVSFSGVWSLCYNTSDIRKPNDAWRNNKINYLYQSCHEILEN